MLRLGLALALLFVAVWAVVRAPTSALWYVAIASTEAGHVLGLGCLLLALPGTRGRFGAVAFGSALLGAVLFFSPTLRATRAGEISLTALYTLPAKVTPETHEYSPGLKLDLYRAAEGAPVVLMIHGGSWSSGDRTQLTPFNHELVHRGYTVAAPNYRLAPEHPFPAGPQDCLAALKWLRAELKPKQLLVMGRSAGGHLALSTAYSAPELVDGVVSLYGPVDLEWSWRNPANPWVIDTFGTLRGFLGGAPEDRGETYKAASPINFVKPVPTLLVHGGRDELVSERHAERLVEVLKGKGVPHTYLHLPWSTHAFDAHPRGPGGQLTFAAIDAFRAGLM